jgi:hypothetical protein
MSGNDPAAPAAAPANPATNDQLAAALIALTGVLTSLQNQQNQPRPPVIQDPFSSSNAFDLSSRAGESAFKLASAPLDTTWDGTTATFPAFIVSLRIRATEARWNATDGTGIMTYTVGGRALNLLDNYSQITKADLEAARASRTNPRAIQNSKCFYSAMKSSIIGTLKGTVFGQAGNLPQVEDGPLLFWTYTSFTMTSSLKLSIMSYHSLTSFDPAEHNFDVPTINTKLSHLFVLSNTASRTLSEEEKIQHVLTAYERIKQPEKWYQWVLSKMDDFDDGTLNNAQQFMNAASVKHLKISATSDSGFGGSANTIQEDIVAMLATNKRKKPVGTAGGPPLKQLDADKSDDSLPPFIKWFKSTAGSDGVLFKVGDTKSFKAKTWNFCDCPNHRGGARWHLHPTSECRTRKTWLKNKQTSPTANLAEEPEHIPDADDPSDAFDSSDGGSDNPSDQVTALLAQALALSSGNEAVAEYIHDALGAM